MMGTFFPASHDTYHPPLPVTLIFQKHSIEPIPPGAQPDTDLVSSLIWFANI